MKLFHRFKFFININYDYNTHIKFTHTVLLTELELFSFKYLSSLILSTFAPQLFFLFLFYSVDKSFLQAFEPLLYQELRQ